MSSTATTTLRPYQVEAINKVSDHLLTHDRAQVKMACGSGKTIVTQEIVEKVVASTENPVVLALFPNLHLVSQTLESWRANARAPFHAFALSSELKSRSTDEDGDIEAGTLNIPNSTSPQDVADWLVANPTGLRVVFGTYQSSHQLATHSAILPEWDLIVFDEAHRAAGAPKSKFSTAVNNDLVPARKRFFATATPLIANMGTRGDGADMNDTTRFGDRVYSYSHQKAVEEGFINDFKVMVIAVTDADLMGYAEKEEMLTLPTGAMVEVQEAAAAIAIAKAGRENPLKATLTYHRNIERSENFSEAFHFLDGVVEEKVPGRPMTNYTVSGADREKSGMVLEHVRNVTPDERLVISNVKLLNEGVDAQGLDSLCFVDPRKSMVDTVQAIGRVIRLDRGNDKQKESIVILPVLVDRLDMSVDEINNKINQSKFQHINNVLEALHAHEPGLDDELFAKSYVAKRKREEHSKLVAEGEFEAAAELQAEMDAEFEEMRDDSLEGAGSSFNLTKHIVFQGHEWDGDSREALLKIETLMVGGRKLTSDDAWRRQTLELIIDRGGSVALAKKMSRDLFEYTMELKAA